MTGKIIFYGVAYVVVGLLSLLPKFILEPITGVLATMASLMFSKKRRIATQQLEKIFGSEKSEPAIRAILKKNFYHIILFSVEFLQIRRWSGEKIKRRVRVAGLENFERAVRENKGVILATAHFGNFPLMAIAGSYLVGPVTFMMNPNLDPGLRTLIETGMSRFGNRALFRGDAVDKIEEILNKKETLCLLMDQRGGKEEYWVDVALLGRRFRFNSGPAFLAFRFGSPVVPVYNFRHKDGSYEIRYGRPISIVHTEDEAEDLKTNMGRMAQTLEAAILESPDHWLFWGWKGFADDFRVGNDDSLVFQKVEYAKREVGKN